MDLSAVYVIWLREMKRFSRDRSQLIVGAVRPLTWLFFMGFGLSAGVRVNQGPDYKQFLLPGLMIMAVLFSSIQSSITIIWDREFGFLKEMLVAPISRTSIVIGKALGGMTMAVVEGLIVLLISPVVAIHLALAPIGRSLCVMALVALALSSLGITIASRMKSFEGFGAIMNFVVMPLFLLSGALFPLQGLPAWLAVLVRANPLTYGVDLLRGVLLHLSHFSVPTSLAALSGFTALMIISAVHQFNHQEL